MALTPPIFVAKPMMQVIWRENTRMLLLAFNPLSLRQFMYTMHLMPSICVLYVAAYNTQYVKIMMVTMYGRCNLFFSKSPKCQLE